MAREKRDRLKALLGSFREHRGAAELRAEPIFHKESPISENAKIDDLRITSDTGETIPAWLCRPASGAGPFPAILYAHAHGDRYDIGRDELVDGRPALMDPPYGPLLAARGYVVLCLDMPTFGGWATVGESAYVKARLWNGATAMGDMLSDLALGLDILAARPDVDAARIGAFGISMGATHAFWLAALDQRVKAVAHLCVYASLAGLIEAGNHDLHGSYLTVPGQLKEFDVGVIAGLVAPRPQLIGVGLADPLTPPAAFEAAFEQTRAAYRRAGAEDRLTRIVEPDSGHKETPAMREAVLAFLDDNLRGPARCR